MTQYAYHCWDCKQQFTVQHPVSQTVATHTTCPHCGSARVQELATAPSPRSFTSTPAPSARSKKAKMRQPRQPRRRSAL